MTKEYKCFCNKIFSRKFNLDRHLSSNACSGIDIKSQLDVYNIIQDKIKPLEKELNMIKEENNELKKLQIINNNCQNANQIVNVNININIEPIAQLSFNDTSNDLMYKMIEKYSIIQNFKSNDIDKQIVSKNVFDAKFLLANYIKLTMTNKNNIKYVNKRPPTYQIAEDFDEDGEIITTIRGLKDSIILLTDPVLNALKIKLDKFEMKLQKTLIQAEKISKETVNELKYDYPLYETTIKALKNELNKKVVQNSLKQFLKNDVLNDINMKLKIIE